MDVFLFWVWAFMLRQNCLKCIWVSMVGGFFLLLFFKNVCTSFKWTILLFAWMLNRPISEHVSIALLFLSAPTASVPQKSHFSLSTSGWVLHGNIPRSWGGSKGLLYSSHHRAASRAGRRQQCDPGSAWALPFPAWLALVLAEGSPQENCCLPTSFLNAAS